MCIHCTYTCIQINTPSQSPNKMGCKNEIKLPNTVTQHFQIAAKPPSQPVFYSKLLHKCPPPAPTPLTNSYLRPKNISRLSLQVFHQKWAPWKAGMHQKSQSRHPGSGNTWGSHSMVCGFHFCAT